MSISKNEFSVLVTSLMLILATAAVAQQLPVAAAEGIVFRGERGIIYLAVPKADGVETTRLSPEGVSVVGEAVSPNGRVAMLPMDRKRIPEGMTDEWATQAGIRTRLLWTTEKRPMGNGAPVEPMVLSPDGRMLYYGVLSLDGSALHSEDLHTGEVRALFKIKGRLDCTSVSPDGTKIAYFRTGDSLPDEDPGLLRLHVYDIATGKDWQVAPPSLVARYGGDHRDYILWSADGTRVFFEAKYTKDMVVAGTWHVAYLDGSRPIREIRGRPESVSPDGKTLYLAGTAKGADSPMGIWTLSLEAEDIEPELLVEMPADAANYRVSPNGTMVLYRATKSDQLRCRFVDTGADILVAPGILGGAAAWTLIPVKQ